MIGDTTDVPAQGSAVHTETPQDLFLGIDKSGFSVLLCRLPSVPTANINKLSGEIQCKAKLNLYLRDADSDTLFNNINGLIKSMSQKEVLEGTGEEWNNRIEYLKQFA